MQLAEVLVVGHVLLRGRGVRALTLLQGSLEIRLAPLLVVQRLRISGPLVRRVRHHLLVILLGSLLLSLRLSHLLLKVLDEQVHHRHDAVALLSLRGVGLHGRRRRRRGIPLGQLHEGHRDTRVGDAARSLCRGRGAALVHEDAVLGGELDFRRGLVHFGIVELLQSVLGEEDQLLGCTVVRHEVLVFGVLLLALLSGLGHGLVKSHNAIFQGSNLLGEGRDAVLGRRHAGLEVRDGALQSLLAVFCLVKFHGAILLLAFVIDLLLLEVLDEIIDELDDLLEADLFAVQRQGDEVEVHATLAGRDPGAELREHGSGLRAEGLRAGLNLHEARRGAGECVFEQF
mmetsp:Transcript_96609/g.272768  ORF Transcript_96609/g.272768 Transcript_96609/m.272768 type:complete len:343 (-) Transcript_96609:1048-2076(-)